MADNFGPDIVIDTRGPNQKFRKLARRAGPAGAKAIQAEAQLFERLLRRALMGTKRRKTDPGPVPVTIPVGRRSGALSRSPRTKKINKFTYSVFIDKKKAARAQVVNDGHRMFLVRPRRKKILAWVVRGHRPGPGNAKGWAAARRSGRARFSRGHWIPARRGTHFYSITRNRFAKKYHYRLQMRFRREVRIRWQ